MKSKPFLFLGIALLVAALVAVPAQAQKVSQGTFQYFAEQCDDDAVRQEFLDDLANGASEDELEFKYGGCRESFEVSPASVSYGELRSIAAASKTIINSNTSYERLTGCGYHPQAEVASCDVELRRRTGYGGFPGGTNEWVRFCLDCDRNGTWDYTTVGLVHVTNDISGGPLSFYFEAHATTFDAPTACITNNGGAGTLRSILSWASKPANCTSRPFWGNTIDVTIRRDP